MREMPFRQFTDCEHETWARLYAGQVSKRDRQVHGLFLDGLRALPIPAGRVPDLAQVNSELAKRTGFRGVAVAGLEEDRSFYEMLSRREFPIGNFIRAREDLSYTPAPDVFHDLYGHLPFFIDPDYANFCHSLGERAVALADLPGALDQFARLFWFAVEFSLINTPEGRRIFGAGIVSSIAECDYALSEAPLVLPFDIETIRHQQFRIDDFQALLFLLSNPRELYECLPEFERRVRRDPNPRTVPPIVRKK